MDAVIEVRDRDSAGERKRPRATICRANDQGVIDDVDRDFEGRLAVMQAAGGEPAHVDIQRSVPPVVPRRGRGEANLAEDLTVEVQGVLGRAPVVHMELRKRHRSTSSCRRDNRPSTRSIWRYA